MRDKEKQKIYRKQYREKHLEKAKKQSKEWNRLNKIRHQKTNREWYLKNKELTTLRNLQRRLKGYGITIEYYNQMFVDQNGLCAICGGHNTNGRPLFVDHCHTTGKVRGLLCSHCNTGIGLLKDNITILQGAIKYLKSHQSG